MKKEHTTKQERNALQTKRAKRNRSRGKLPHTAWMNSSYSYKQEVAARLAYRFADKHDVSPVGLPSAAGIRRELNSLDVEQLQALHADLKVRKEFYDGEG